MDKPDPSRASIQLKGHQSWIRTLDISFDNHWLVTGGGDKVALLWDISNILETRNSTPVYLKGPTGAITDAKISYDNSFIVTASDDSTARIWKITDNAQSIEKTIILRAHHCFVSKVEIIRYILGRLIPKVYQMFYF